MSLQIARISAHALKVPLHIDVPGVGVRHESFGCCVVEVETSDGLIGHGLTGITQQAVIAAIVNEVIAPALTGKDPLAHEARWEDMYWLLCSRGQTGYAQHAMAAVDIALWDIKGHVLNTPIWRLLGGARRSVETYSTFGFDFLERDELAAAAGALCDTGYRHLKMVVGHRGLQHRDRGRPLAKVIEEDARRVRAVHEVIPDDATLYIDANCSLDLFHAERLARSLDDCRIGFFEEPITQNDAAAMAGLRQRTGMALACGQAEGLAFRYRDLMVAGAVDVIQPNVVIGGGFTQCLRIAGMASAFNVSLANGGAFPLHNLHLHAGLANGGKVEWHLPVVALMKELYSGFDEPVAGQLAVSDKPGLGFQLRREALNEYGGGKAGA